MIRMAVWFILSLGLGFGIDQMIEAKKLRLDVFDYIMLLTFVCNCAVFGASAFFFYLTVVVLYLIVRMIMRRIHADDQT
jgi:hypothetical protein